jgi:3-dehydroquinate synthase class II
VVVHLVVALEHRTTVLLMVHTVEAVAVQELLDRAPTVELVQATGIQVAVVELVKLVEVTHLQAVQE